MNKDSFTNLTNEYLQFAFAEADKSLAESLTSFREIIKKSYIAVAFYLSALIYFFNHSHNCDILGFWIYTCLTMVSALCIGYTSFNLYSAPMHSPGTEPIYSIDPFYQNKQDQIREFLISKLLHIDVAINFNYKEVAMRNERFRNSAIAFVVSCILAFLYWLFRN